MIVFTGASGFLGKQVLGRMLLEDPESEFLLLLRAKSQEHAEKRTKSILFDLFGENKPKNIYTRVFGLASDMTKEYMGLGRSNFDNLAKKTSSLFHLAADTNLAQTLKASREVNVKGVLNAINLLKKSKAYGNDPILFHVSTAYVAGDVEQVVTPYELNLNRSFKNAYEQSKAESEVLVRDASTKIKTCIFRPSVIVGDSITGQTQALNVIYVPARFIACGLIKALPAIPNTPFDIVPVNYVADAIVNLSRKKNSIGKSYHLSSGLGRESSPLEILDCIIDTLNKYKNNGSKSLERPVFLSPEAISLIVSSLTVARAGMNSIGKLISKRMDVMKYILPFMPYMLKNPRFDSSLTISDFNGEISEPPLFKHYAERVFKYCLDTNWGKIPWQNPNKLTTWPYYQ